MYTRNSSSLGHFISSDFLKFIMGASCSAKIIDVEENIIPNLLDVRFSEFVLPKIKERHFKE